MNKKKLEKMLNAKIEAKKGLQDRAKACEDVKELRSINNEMETINTDIIEFRAMITEIEEEEKRAAKTENNEEVEARTDAVNEEEETVEKRNKTSVPGFIPVASMETEQEEKRENLIKKAYETRGKDLREKRSVTVASSSILLQKHQSSEIGGTFNEVSGLIDRVTQKPLLGGESYSKPYVKGYGEGGYTTEGGDPTTAETQFGYADINKTKITAYAEDTEELEKLPSANYAMEVEKGVKVSIRKKITKQILIGDGSTNNIMGIFNTTTIDAGTDLAVTEIDNTTLDDIIFSYGGDEDVEDACVLILNKSDLKAFSQLRTTDGKKYHTIVAQGNVGTIDGIPYIINSACKAISAKDTLENNYCMAYGPLSNYELAIFSDMDIKKSTDYKFKEGMICHRGVCFCGGNVVAKDGFLRVKKGAAGI